MCIAKEACISPGVACSASEADNREVISFADRTTALAMAVLVAGAAACSGGARITGGGGTSGSASGGSSGAGTAGKPGSSGGAGGLGRASGDGGAGTGHAGSSGRACPGAKPDATNTGVPPGVALTVIDHDVTVTDDNAVIDAQDIHGFLIIRASHVRVTRSIVRGRATTSNAGVIRVDSGTDVLIEDTEIAVAAPSATVDGLWGEGFTARRLDIHGGVDGIKASSNDTIACSYVHDLASFASDPNQGGGPTHNDAIQILEGSSIRIVGNQLVAATDQNAAIQVTQDFGAVTDLRIDGNWADGGACTFNLAHKVADALTVSTSGSRFGRHSFFDCPILKSTKTTLVSSGDVWDDDGSKVPVQTHD
jgi:hypothetical protein